MKDHSPLPKLTLRVETEQSNPPIPVGVSVLDGDALVGVLGIEAAPTNLRISAHP